jgi:hypothetical protein
MKKTLLALTMLVACGGPLDVPGGDAGIDALPGAIDTEPAADTIPVSVCQLCEDGYALAHYYPSTSVYCEPTGTARVTEPCHGSRVINWLQGGVVECAVIAGCEPNW